MKRTKAPSDAVHSGTVTDETELHQSQSKRFIDKARDEGDGATIKASRKLVGETNRDLQHTRHDIEVTKASLAASVERLTGKNDGRSQSEKFIAKARELGLDEREETFDAALTQVARHKLDTKKPPTSKP